MKSVINCFFFILLIQDTHITMNDEWNKNPIRIPINLGGLLKNKNVVNKMQVAISCRSGSFINGNDKPMKIDNVITGSCEYFLMKDINNNKNIIFSVM
nr:hypothetical protein [Xenorhabdus bovienii]